jgi:type I restriction enzyme S subunit
MDIVNYEHVPIKRIGKVITGKTPATSHEEYYGGQYMFISPVELHGGYRVTKSEKTITEKGLESIKTNSIEGISILVGCIGWDMGNVAMCFEKCATNQQINAITQIDAKYNPYYIYYWLCGKKKYLFSIASVTRTPILSKSTFEEIVIPLPIKKNQDKIANILLKIDQKITLNKQINDNLSAMAYDIYMHTFFSKKPNAKLKDILTEAEKSVIQVGEAKASNGEYPFFTSGATILKWNEPFVDGRNCFLNTGGNADVKFYVGKAAYSTDTWSISAKSEMSDYLYLMLFSIKPELDQKFFQGTGLKHLQKPLLKDRPIYVPEKMELEAFNRQVMPMFDIISENTRENQQLTSLRDWLLPMLMNGQATIND